MIFSWFARQRRKSILAEPMPPAWLDFLTRNVRHYQHLSPRRQVRLRQVVQVLVAEKNWVGGSGFEITEEMKVTIAGQAAVLAVGMKEPYYFDAVQSIIVYPGAYMAERGSARLGESWYRGPIVLAWRDALAAGRNESNGHNLVLHEFAHYVDALDGEVDGTPPLVGRERRRTWFRVTEAEYLRLVGKARRNEVSLLDHYGATNRAEFFAVATECFFERPHALWREHRQLYRVLRDFYRQHPMRWLPDANVAENREHAPSEKESARRLRQRQKRLGELRSRDAGTLFKLAVTYFNERRYLLAGAVASRLIALDPGDGEAYAHRAFARIQRERFAAALDDAESALACDPGDPEAYVARAAGQIALGKFAEAKADLDRALELDHDDAEVRYYRGRAWMGLGKPAKALRDYWKSLAKRIFDAEVHYHTGLAYRVVGDKAEAKVHLAKARQLDPELFKKLSGNLTAGKRK